MLGFSENLFQNKNKVVFSSTDHASDWSNSSEAKLLFQRAAKDLPMHYSADSILRLGGHGEFKLTVEPKSWWERIISLKKLYCLYHTCDNESLLSESISVGFPFSFLLAPFSFLYKIYKSFSKENPIVVNSDDLAGNFSLKDGEGYICVDYDGKAGDHHSPNSFHVVLSKQQASVEPIPSAVDDQMRDTTVPSADDKSVPGVEQSAKTNGVESIYPNIEAGKDNEGGYSGQLEHAVDAVDAVEPTAPPAANVVRGVPLQGASDVWIDSNEPELHLSF